MSNDVNLENIVILTTCIIKEDEKFYYKYFQKKH